MQNISFRVIDVYPYRWQGAELGFLLLKRSAQKQYGAQWRMVGGKIKAGETAWQAALRELEEETGQKPMRFWSLPSVNLFYEWQHDRINLIPAFAAELLHDPVLDGEHEAFGWFSLSEAMERLLWHEQRRLLALTHQILVADRVLPDWEISLLKP